MESRRPGSSSNHASVGQRAKKNTNGYLRRSLPVNLTPPSRRPEITQEVESVANTQNPSPRSAAKRANRPAHTASAGNLSNINAITETAERTYPPTRICYTAERQSRSTPKAARSQSPSKAAPTAARSQSPSKAVPTAARPQSPSKAAPKPGRSQSPSKAVPKPGRSQSPSKVAPKPGRSQSPTKAKLPATATCVRPAPKHAPGRPPSPKYPSKISQPAAPIALSVLRCASAEKLRSTSPSGREASRKSPKATVDLGARSSMLKPPQFRAPALSPRSLHLKGHPPRGYTMLPPTESGICSPRRASGVYGSPRRASGICWSPRRVESASPQNVDTAEVKSQGELSSQKSPKKAAGQNRHAKPQPLVQWKKQMQVYAEQINRVTGIQAKKGPDSPRDLPAWHS